MGKAIFITFFAFVFYLTEFILFNTIGGYFKPNLLLLLVIFANFAFGIRFSIVAAVICGFLQDSFSTSIFGISFLSYILCAYAVTVLSRIANLRGRMFSRLWIVFCVVSINVILQFFLHLIFVQTSIKHVFLHIYLPEVITTLLVTNMTFGFLKSCVSKLYTSL